MWLAVEFSDGIIHNFMLQYLGLRFLLLCDCMANLYMAVEVMKKIFVIVCMCFILLWIVGCTGSSTVGDNNAAFSESVKAIDVDIITLNELVTFEWDTMYTFTPFTPRESIERVIGFSSRDIRTTFNESQTQLIFVRDGRIVSSIWGYGNNLGYWISFGNFSGDYFAVTPNDTVLFSVDRSGTEILLTHIQE